jgi:hypothetical protein
MDVDAKVVQMASIRRRRIPCIIANRYLDLEPDAFAIFIPCQLVVRIVNILTSRVYLRGSIEDQSDLVGRFHLFLFLVVPDPGQEELVVLVHFLVVYLFGVHGSDVCSRFGGVGS